MAKQITYSCTACGAQLKKWAGQCPECLDWNCVEETTAKVSISNKRLSGYAGEVDNKVQRLSDVEAAPVARTHSGMSELDRVLGGGLVEGSVVLIGGDPGIGKSTLLLQMLAQLSTGCNALYISGEESAQQISLRAQRLDLVLDSLDLLTETHIEKIIAIAKVNKPTVIVVDSIQTIFSDALQSVPGSVAQIKEATAQIVRFAKQYNISIFLVGHVTKEGALAGPRVLEHMVDTVLYFEGDNGSPFRLVRAIKNRFGAVNELGIFSMGDKGLREISNPSAIFLSGHQESAPGSVVLVTREGTRPLLVEIQALVDESPLGNPRRVALGIEQNRLSMLLAVMHRHGGIAMHDQDVYVNAVGGVRIGETASDLAVIAAIYSSFRNRVLPEGLVVFGELGLSGEIRPVQNGPERLKEAAKHGFKYALVPKQNIPPKGVSGLTIQAVSRLEEVLDYLNN